MTASYTVLRLLVAACLACMCLPNKSWLLQAKSSILRSGSLEYLKTEKGRLDNAVQELNRVESVLREENAELKRKVNTLNLRVSSLRKKELFLQSKHRKYVSDLNTLHASTIAKLQTSKSKEIASVTSKVREQHEVERRELRTTLEAAHAQEIAALKKELSSAGAAVEQRDHEIKQLKDELALNQAEVKRYVDKVTEGIAERDALIEVSSAHLPSSRLLANTILILSFFSFPGNSNVIRELGAYEASRGGAACDSYGGNSPNILFNIAS